MINKIHIQNFKSINDLELDAGRVNLFIGENGSGKSNLLEALVFASANDSNKLDNEFLTSRGLRTTEPKFMRSAFSEESIREDIKINVTFMNNILKEYKFSNDNDTYNKWIDINSKPKERIKELYIENLNLLKELEKTLKNLKGQKNSIKTTDIDINNKKVEFKNRLNELSLLEQLKLENFIIFSPENTALRNFYKEGQIEPLGINGEGLLKLIKIINNYEDKEYIKTIKKSLELFNWFESIDIPEDLSSSEDKVIIKDKFLYKEFDQRSANEGFLFILFYITLVVAKETPKAFAIDNIDASLNPKLCTKLILLLTDLAKKYDKQIFLTTHNPAILDGIDLNNDEQKLFVVSRNKSGHTRAKEITIENKPKSSNDEPIKLSEAFLRGYLGGLPKGF